MIHLVMGHVLQELNDYLYALPPTPDAGRTTPARRQVVAESLFDFDGKVKEGAKNKVVASIVNVEEDRVYHSVDVFQRRDDGTSELVKPEVRVNLHILFVANYASYEEAMKMLSRVIAFFQHRSSFAYKAIDGLADRDGHFIFELFTLSFEQQNHLWGALGAKYMPSVMFKLASSISAT